MNILKKLADIQGDRTIVLYGGGTGGINFLKLLKKARPDLHIRCFIDSFKEGEQNGLPVIRANDFFSGTPSHFQVLVTSIFWRDIENALLKAGIANYILVPQAFLQISFYDYIERNPHRVPAEIPCSSTRFTAEDWQRYGLELGQTRQLLAHEEDRRLFDILSGKHSRFNTCLEEIACFLKEKEPAFQYVEFTDFRNIKMVIEAGVFNGQDTLNFAKRILPDGKVYGFEPFTDAYLNSPLKKKLDANDSITIIDRGLWSNKARLSFKICGHGSRIINERDNRESDDIVSIDVISIDEFVRENRIQKVDFIKLDIEGAEMEALKGAVNTLKNHRPQLAICIYHSQKDLFEIPLFLNGVLSNYEYRLGHYTLGFAETIWYGKPGELY
ncbi:MAG: FkbM family methyltransferase [bacterium]|nr:FkbM family methyltransferase [bacterium]